MDVAAVNQPASHISGDFYNWFELPDGRQVVVIGDVTGHGMAAAFLMATTQLLVRNTMATVPDPGPCHGRGQPPALHPDVQRPVRHHDDHGPGPQQRGHMDVATAGHPAPLISEGGPFRELHAEAQLALGIDRTIHYPTQRFDLPARASILLYTDGVVDAQASTGERYSTELLLHALYGRFANAQQLVDTVVRAVNEFRAGKELDDDLTLVAIQLQGAAPQPAEDAATPLAATAGS